MLNIKFSFPYLFKVFHFTSTPDKKNLQTRINLNFIVTILYTWRIHWIRWIMPKELTAGNTGYSCSFFEETNSHLSFYVSEGCQHDLLYWLLHLVLFLYRRESVCFYSMNCFFNQFCCVQSMFVPFINIFFAKTCFSVYIAHSSVNFI